MHRRLLLVALIALIATPVWAAPLDVGNARRVSLDADWRFLKGDAEGAEQPGFDDHTWRALDVPHDWAIEGPFDKSLDPQTGALPYAGIGWYRKHFTLADGVRGRHLEVLFDGAMSNARVWLNGHEIASRPYGYSSFGADLTPYLAFARQDNVLAVRLAPEPESSRWYPGAGIYRHVWLDVTDPVHVPRWGTSVTTPSVDAESAHVNVRAEIANATEAAASVTVETAIVDADGAEVVRGTPMPATAEAGSSVFVESTLTIPHPVRWDLDAAVSVSRRHGRAVGVGRARSLRHVVRRPHDRLRQDHGLLAQRAAREVPGGLPAPRPRRARGRDQPPGARASAADHEGDGRECHPHEPQPAGARAARSRRHDGLARHGRSLRHVEQDEGQERPRQVFRASGATATCAT